MKFIAIGELMLRLSPPNYEKLVTTHDFRVNYGGAEANVAVSLANLGVDSTFNDKHVYVVVFAYDAVTRQVLQAEKVKIR